MSSYILQLQEVEKSFKKVKAVNKLSFEIKVGEIFALLGPNGAGKTSTVRMIMQIIQPDAGSINFSPSFMNGSEVDKTKIGYLPEERGLYQDTGILNTLNYIARLRGTEQETANKEGKEWLKRLDLFERRNDKISTLSKGNQQKVQFIASILHRPQFIVIDEPFSGFDPLNQQFICDLLLELREQGTTILLSAHQMELVERIADRIMLINDGSELISGTLDEMRKKLISDQKLMVKFTGFLSTEEIEKSPDVSRVEVIEDGEIAVYLEQNHSLNRVLSHLVQIGEIQKINMRSVSLHEIFLKSFNS